MGILTFITKDDGILSMASTLSRGPICLKVIQFLPENVMFNQNLSATMIYLSVITVIVVSSRTVGKYLQIQ